MFPPEGVASFLKFDSFFPLCNVVFMGIGIMKKIVWVVLGCAVLIGAGLLIGHSGKSGKPDGLERTQGSQETESVETTVSQAARLPGGGESRRAGGGTGQGLQDAGDTEGQTGKSAPRRSEAVKALL